MEVTLLQSSPPENTRDSTRVLIFQVLTLLTWLMPLKGSHRVSGVSYILMLSYVLIHIADT